MKRVCVYCGAENADGFESCMRCGFRLPLPPDQCQRVATRAPTTKTRLLGIVAVAFVLLVVFGSSGDSGLFIVSLGDTKFDRIAGKGASFHGWLDNDHVLLEDNSVLEVADLGTGDRRRVGEGKFFDVEVSPNKALAAFTRFTNDGTIQLGMVDIASGDSQVLAESDALSYPTWSDDSAYIVYGAQSTEYFVSVKGGTPQPYVPGEPGTPPTWAPCSRLVYCDNSGIYSTRGIGAFTPAPGSGICQCSPNGNMVAIQGSRSSVSAVEVFAIDGSGSLGVVQGRLAQGTWSPDSKKVGVYRDENGRRSLVVMDLTTGQERVLVSFPSDGRSCWNFLWSPDSRWLAFSAGDVKNVPEGKQLSGTNGLVLYLMRADGTQLMRVPSPLRLVSPCAWSPDGTRIVACAKTQPIIEESD